jgi:aspartyl-tRNA(Asn)/glutamyl-tRNA(Gln) amidotransferase subunit C
MSFSVDDIKRAAHLARLTFEAAELAAYESKLSRVVAMADQLSSVDTRGVAPLAHPLDMVQRLREDQVTEIDQHVLAQSIAPAVEAGLYLVPAVIEGHE